MATEFTKSMFIMLLTIMIGAVIITFFVADIVNRSKIETLTTEYKAEISTISSKSENFTSYFLKSSVVLDQARSDLSLGNYHFDLAYLWYNNALSEKNTIILELYKTRGTDNCTVALPYYIYSHDNYIDAKSYFNDTKSFTNYKLYLEILDLYLSLTDSGSNLSRLKYNATTYLLYLSENLTFDKLNNTVAYLVNVTNLLMGFDATMQEYLQELENYNEIQNAIDEYEFFEEAR